MRAGEDQGLLWLVALALLGSFISLYYYLIVLKVIFVDETSVAEPGMKIDVLQRISLTVLAVVVLFIGVWPATLLTRIIAALS